ERLGKAGKRARNHPKPRLVPEGQVTGDDVAHHALRDHRIGFGEHGAAGVQFGLGGQAAVRSVVASVGHVFFSHAGRMSWRRNRAMRSTCWQAVANSVSRSFSMRVWNAARMLALVLSFTAMMNGK